MGWHQAHFAVFYYRRIFLLRHPIPALASNELRIFWGSLSPLYQSLP
jgi:hypothetical protein